MANVSFSLNRGGDAFSVVEGTDAPSTGDLEVSINLSNFATAGGTPINNEIRILLDHIANWIVGHSAIVT
ncbi:MAG: hypothetical protein ACLQAT_20105 [Candidatus Binataceae bacterium]